MSFLSSLISISNPLWLLGIPISGLLLSYIYRKQKYGEQIVVPTTIIWKHLASDSATPRKRFIPWRFLFDLLLCSLLSLACAGISFTNKTNHAVLLIDNSFSTRAIYPDQIGSKTVFDRIIARAERALRQDRSLSWQLYATSPQLTALNTDFLNSIDATQKLKTIKPVFSTDKLESAISKLSDSKSNSQIIVITDRPANASTQTRQSNVVIHSIRDNTLSWNNISIEAIKTEYRPKTFDTHVNLQLANYSDRTLNVNLQIKRLDRLDRKKTGKLISKKRVVLSPEQNYNFDLFLPTNKTNLYEVTLETEKTNLDLIEDDNKAWIVTSGTNNIFAVVSPLSLQELGLNDIPSYSFVKKSIAQIENSELEDFVGIILHRQNISKIFSKNTLIVYPQLTENSDSFITNWNQAHKLLRYVSQSNITLGTTITLNPPNWAEHLIETPQGTVLFSGENNGNRYIYSGIEIFPYQGKLTPSLSILNLNFLNWLNYNASTEEMGLVYQQPKLVPASQIQIVYSDTLSATNKNYNELDIPGIYYLSSNKNSFYRAVNFFEKTESKLNQLKPVEIIAEQTTNAQKQVSWSSLTIITWLFLLLLLFEACFLTIKRVYRYA